MIGHYLMFNRNCAEALELYAKAFNAKIPELQKYGDMPGDPKFPVSNADKNLVLHGRLVFGDHEIMASDSSQRCESGSNMYVTITTKDKEMVIRAWDLLNQGGHVYMELTATFFALLHGSLKDRFGINWMFTVMK